MSKGVENSQVSSLFKTTAIKNNNELLSFLYYMLSF